MEYSRKNFEMPTWFEVQTESSVCLIAKKSILCSKSRSTYPQTPCGASTFKTSLKGVFKEQVGILTLSFLVKVVKKKMPSQECKRGKLSMPLAGERHVRIPVEHGAAPPACDCSFHKSTLLICGCICAVYGRVDHALLDERNLQPLWRLCNHPLWWEAHADLGLTLPAGNNDDTCCDAKPAAATNVDDVDDNNSSGSVSLAVNKEAFAGIHYPKKRDTRYSRLMEACKDLTASAIDSESAFKHAMCVITGETQFLDSNTRASIAAGDTSTDFIAIKPPLSRQERKRGRVPDSAIANKAKWGSKAKAPPKRPTT